MRTVYLDMDGVLADFDSYCVKLIGKLPKEFPTSSEGWRALGEHKYTMYKNLDPMPGAAELVRYVTSLSREYNFTIGILTAVPKIGTVPLAKQHKVEWLIKYFPQLLYDFNIGPWAQDKYKHCIGNDILIDDSKMNIDQWNKVNGCGVLYQNNEQTFLDLKNILIATTLDNR